MMEPTRDNSWDTVLFDGFDGMEPFRPLLLEIWREACRHIEIQEATANITTFLAKHLPLGGVIVRRVEEAHRTIATVAAAGVGRWVPPEPSGSPVSVTQLRRLRRWGEGRKLLRQRQDDSSAESRVLIPLDIRGDVLVGPLGAAGALTGVLIVVAKEGHAFDAEHRKLVRALLEPFSVALDNDHRVHELASLRETAEAERRTLLTRLGRSEMDEPVVGVETGLKPVMERVALVAPSDAPVLILGETGTGKEVIARAIHNRSPRHANPFIRVNCGAIPAELIDSQLFGHEKGSFTGAGEMRQGWFERADGGTLFLDEIGELPLQAQVRFLRVLQDGYLERVGGQQPIRVDVRIVAATHRDLASMVQHKEFREDLWYRLAVFPLVLPPLRERLDDISELAQHFSERSATRLGLPLVRPTPEDILLLAEYDWPGNIRELRTVIERAAILGDGKRLEIAKALGVIPPRVAQPASLTSHTAPRPGSFATEAPTREGLLTLDDAVRRHIERALQATRGKIEGPRGTAALLHINPHTLRAKMRKLSVDWSRFRD
ncbi:MAG: sigma-54 dependent transcriptional regulator [Planctomycetia bacterium]|nr:sigma-54 dependent transcriptional regulator [Planctomycetia bacterium]